MQDRIFGHPASIDVATRQQYPYLLVIHFYNDNERVTITYTHFTNAQDMIDYEDNESFVIDDTSFYPIAYQLELQIADHDYLNGNPCNIYNKYGYIDY